MKSLLAMTTAALVVLALGGVDAKAHAGHHTEMVQSWYQHYLRRQPDPQGLHTWVCALQNGANPADVQASILASEEYFCLHGHTNTGYVTALYTDLTGRAPCAEEVERWTHRLHHLGCRKRLALDFCAAIGPAPATRAAGPVVVAPVVTSYYSHARTVVPIAPAPHVAPLLVQPAMPVYPPAGVGVRTAVGYPRR